VTVRLPAESGLPADCTWSAQVSEPSWHSPLMWERLSPKEGVRCNVPGAADRALSVRIAAENANGERSEWTSWYDVNHGRRHGYAASSSLGASAEGNLDVYAPPRHVDRLVLDGSLDDPYARQQHRPGEWRVSEPPPPPMQYIDPRDGRVRKSVPVIDGSYDPRYDPRHDPRCDRRYDPHYDPRYDPRCDPYLPEGHYDVRPTMLDGRMLPAAQFLEGAVVAPPARPVSAL